MRGECENFAIQAKKPFIRTKLPKHACKASKRLPRRFIVTFSQRQSSILTLKERRDQGSIYAFGGAATHMKPAVCVRASMKYRGVREEPP